jgi:DNA-directed RNA polymerase
MDETLGKIQIELEAEQVNMGIDKYRRDVRKAKEKGNEKNLLPHKSLLHTVIPKLSEGIDTYRNRPNAKGGVPLAISITKDVDADLLSFITCTEIINNMNQHVTVQTVCKKISKAIRDYMHLEDFKENCGGLYKYAQDKINTSNVKHKRSAMRHYADFGGINEPEMRNHMQVGLWFLERFKETCPGIIETYTNKISKNNTPKMIRPSKETYEWLQDQHHFYEDQFPKNMPMVVKPYPWTNGYDGGYLLSEYPLIKYQSRETMAELHDKYYLDRVYKAINAIQETAWQINKDVLKILHEFYDNNVQSVLVPGIFFGHEPEMPCENDDAVIEEYKKEHPNEWQAWKNNKSAYWSKLKHSGSHSHILDRQIKLADKFKDFKELYFPHSMCFRGRIYPLVSVLQPQGNDLSKALLHFGMAHEIGPHGDRWLKIHMANCYGNDKVSLDDRVKWAEENEMSFLMIAKDPMTNRSMWENTDSPWQYLAACYEYARYKFSGEGEKFKSTLAVGVDGTCSGIQHLAALTLDRTSGEQVNLCPSDKPSDIYQQVCDVVERNIADSKDTYANMWKGKITRKALKSNVMTFAYGSTHKGRQNQIRDYLRKEHDKGTPVFDFPKSMTNTERKNIEWNLVMFLATEAGKAIDEVLQGPTSTMNWFKAIVREFNKEKKPMTWVTPVGFPVVQNYKKFETKILDTNFEQTRLRVKLTQPTERLDTAKCSSGFSPNLIHSHDSAHCLLSVNRLVDMGVDDFGMVHDSFSTHLGHVEDLTQQLRLTFIEMYRGNKSEELWQYFQEQLGRALPKPPQPGDLDITRIMESDYFFN